MVERMKAPKEPLPIGLVGKYVELRDAYLSVREALSHAAMYHDREVNLLWINSEDLEESDDNIDRLLGKACGIVVSGGFGYRGIEGMAEAAKYAREHEVPYLGLCLGMQVMVVEYARYIFNSSEPNSTEFVPDTPYPIIDLLPEQRGVRGKGGTMRLGAYPCCLVEDTLAAAAYRKPLVYERHRHRFEFNNNYRSILEKVSLIASGLSPQGELVEIMELRNHPWLVGVQFHPEFRSRPNHPHPLFLDFISKAKETLREGAQRSLPL
jgi:CTP synthase